VSVTWLGLVAPPKTPPEIAERLAAVVADAVREPAVQRRIADMNVEPVAGTPAQMAAVIREDIERWKPVIESAKIMVD
jgi:tripartite-type tricarboxylate transporter receptor subunit TctC